jgi:Chitobiase/beta-hexosaminidase C-terminal domain
MKKQPPRMRFGHTALVASAALAATALTDVPASATLSGPGVATGHNITVFHNIDFVAVFGWALGESLTVSVERDGVLIGTATGPTVDTPEGPGLEVNHGPEGAPVAGDCWEGHTPDIRPGDVVRVTNGTVTDQVTVDDIAFTGRPSELRSGDIVVPFVAKRANGTAIPAAFIDSAEFRAASNNQVRFEGNRVLVERQPGGAPGEYRMRYRSPFRPNRNDDNAPFNQAQLRRALLGDGHSVGFGHVAPLPLESMLHDGLGDTPGPAPGCEAAPSAQWKVNTVAPGAINLANQADGLTVRGLSQDASAVTVALSDNDPATTGNPTATATLSQAAGRQTWNATFTPQQLRDLNRTIRVRATIALADGNITDSSQTVLKDVVRPNEPRASVAPGTYQRPKEVALRAGGAQIRYTLGDGSQAAPTARTGARYTGRKVRITSTQVLKAVSIDPAGNVSTVARLRYRIR